MDVGIFSFLLILMQFGCGPAAALLLFLGMYRLLKVLIRNRYTVPVSQYPRQEAMTPEHLEKLKLQAERGDKTAARRLVDYYAFALETPREERLAQYQYWRKILNSSTIRRKTEPEPPAKPQPPQPEDKPVDEETKGG
ncbi:MAG: hypothetical protein ACAI35_07445 [Candidatus Methylacidiphilales bacterium]